MAEAIVKKRFRDLQNKQKLYMPGQKFSGDETRITELKEKGLLETVKRSKKEAVEK